MLLASLVGTALVMGLAGTPHCLAMCGVATTGVGRVCAGPQGRAGGVLFAWLIGRVLAYAALGALAATGLHTLGWLREAAPWLQPAWVMLHAGLLVLGLALVWQGRLPRWLDKQAAALSDALRRASGRGVSQDMHRGIPEDAVPSAPRGRPLAAAAAAGLAWGLLPCGLLYAAVMLAALAGGPWQGALVMAVFALGSGAGLLLGPWAWLRWRAVGRGTARALAPAAAGPAPASGETGWVAVRVSGLSGASRPSGLSNGTAAQANGTAAQAPGSAAGGPQTAVRDSEPRWAVRLAGGAIAGASAWAMMHGWGPLAAWWC